MSLAVKFGLLVGEGYAGLMYLCEYCDTVRGGGLSNSTASPGCDTNTSGREVTVRQW